MKCELFANTIGRIGIPMRDGPNQGLKWSLVNLRKGYLNGTFERARIELIATLIRPDDCFWDIGAHRGYVSMLAARAVEPERTVYAFEPARRNLAILRMNMQINRLHNVQVTPVALSEFNGLSSFGGSGSVSLRLGGGPERVQVRTIDSLLHSGEYEEPTFLKIDVEGAEASVLRGAEKALDRSDMLVLVSIHSPDQYAACLRLLTDRGYCLEESPALRRAVENRWAGAPPPDPDLLAFRPGRKLSEGARQRFLEAE